MEEDPYMGTAWLKVGNVILGVCYIPHEHSTVYSNPNIGVGAFDHFEAIQQRISHYQAHGYKVVVCGDFNARVGEEEDNPISVSGEEGTTSWETDGHLHAPISDIPQRHTQDSVRSNKLGRLLLGGCQSSGINIWNGRVAGDELGAFTFIADSYRHSPLAP